MGFFTTECEVRGDFLPLSHLKYACQKVKKTTLFSDLSTSTHTDRHDSHIFSLDPTYNISRTQ